MNLQKLIFQLRQEAKGISAFGWPADYQHLTKAADELQSLTDEIAVLKQRNEQQVTLLVTLRERLKLAEEEIRWMEEEVNRVRAGKGQTDRIKSNTTEAIRRLNIVLDTVGGAK